MAERKIEVVAYNPHWAEMFSKERQLLAARLSDVAVNIEHIGSTSVNGLSAKPIIDILIEVSSLKALDERNKALESLGYKVKGENGIAGRRYFQKGGNERTHHLHCFLSGDDNLERHRIFKAYLIAHPAVAHQYAEIKQQAVTDCMNDSTIYMSLKNDFIQKHETLALDWFEK